MKKYASIFLVFLYLQSTSCSEFQKALKSEDIAQKYELATKLYDSEKFAKANRLFAQIVPSYRGKPQAEKLMYMYARSFYELKDFHLAGYQFENFTKSYPKSEKVEEASFYGAKSFFMMSPIYSKDQKETLNAIEKLQLFIDQYDSSEFIGQANKMIVELDFKLEKKAFEIAKQYNDISDYKAAIKSFDNFLLEYPGSNFREEVMFYRLDSAYKLAMNSIDYKKEQRIEDCKLFINSFLDTFPNSERKEWVEEMSNEIEVQLKNLNKNS